MKFLKKVKTWEDIEYVEGRDIIYYDAEDDITICAHEPINYITFTVNEYGPSSIIQHLKNGSTTTLSLPIGESKVSLPYGFHTNKQLWGTSATGNPQSITAVDLSEADFSKVTNLNLMFAFYSITSIDVSNLNTQNIESCQGTFNYCTNLQSIDLSNWDMSNVSNTDGMFFQCYTLTAVTLPNSIKIIGQKAFENCHDLTSIIIPDSVTSIGSSAFYSCTSLASVVYKGVTYTSKAALQSAFDANGVTCTVTDAFMSTALTA